MSLNRKIEVSKLVPAEHSNAHLTGFKQKNWIMPQTDDHLVLDIKRNSVRINGLSFKRIDKKNIIASLKELINKDIFTADSDYALFTRSYNQSLKDFGIALLQESLVNINPLPMVKGDVELKLYRQGENVFCSVQTKEIILQTNTFTDHGIQTTEFSIPGTLGLIFELTPAGFQLLEISTDNADLQTMCLKELPSDSKMLEKYSKQQRDLNLAKANFDRAVKSAPSQSEILIEGKRAQTVMPKVSSNADNKQLTQILAVGSNLITNPNKNNANQFAGMARSAMKRKGWKVFAGAMLCLLGAVMIAACIVTVAVALSLLSPVAIPVAGLAAAALISTVGGSAATAGAMAGFAIGGSLIGAGCTMFAKPSAAVSLETLPAIKKSAPAVS